MTDIVTLWVRTEGLDAVSIPLLCAPKAVALAAGRALDDHRITIPESAWTPCCRAPGVNCACIRDHFDEPELGIVREVISAAAERAGIILPPDEATS